MPREEVALSFYAALVKNALLCSQAVGALVDAGVLVEFTGRRRDRTFGYAAYLNRLRAGTDL